MHYFKVAIVALVSLVCSSTSVNAPDGKSCNEIVPSALPAELPSYPPSFPMPMPWTYELIGIADVARNVMLGRNDAIERE